MFPFGNEDQKGSINGHASHAYCHSNDTAQSRNGKSRIFIPVSNCIKIILLFELLGQWFDPSQTSLLRISVVSILVVQVRTWVVVLGVLFTIASVVVQVITFINRTTVNLADNVIRLLICEVDSFPRVVVCCSFPKVVHRVIHVNLVILFHLLESTRLAIRTTVPQVEISLQLLGAEKTALIVRQVSLKSSGKVEGFGTYSRCRIEMVMTNPVPEIYL